MPYSYFDNSDKSENSSLAESIFFIREEKISLQEFRQDPEIFDRVDLNIKMKYIFEGIEDRSVDQIQQFFRNDPEAKENRLWDLESADLADELIRRIENGSIDRDTLSNLINYFD
jgi:hypothetical protein